MRSSVPTVDTRGAAVSCIRYAHDIHGIPHPRCDRRARLETLDARRPLAGRSGDPRALVRHQLQGCAGRAPARAASFVRYPARRRRRSRGHRRRSTDAGSIAAGDRVLVTGCGLSETRDGGYARVRARAGRGGGAAAADARSARCDGHRHGGLRGRAVDHAAGAQRPRAGPAGRSRSPAPPAAWASSRSTCSRQRGHEVVAVTRKPAEWRLPACARCRGGASRATTLGGSDRPLEPARWAGAIDNVGGAMLVVAAAQPACRGGVAAVGLAGGRRAQREPHAVPAARREPARRQFGRHAAREAARGLAAHRHRPAPRHLETHRHATRCRSPNCPPRSSG